MRESLDLGRELVDARGRVVRPRGDGDRPHGRRWRRLRRRGRGRGLRLPEQVGDLLALPPRDKHSVELQVLHYNEEGPPYFGLELNAHWVPPTPEWGAHLYFSEGGRNILGEGFGVSFFREINHKADPTNGINLGNGYAYSIFKRSVTLAFRGEAPRVTAARYLGSAEALRKEGLDLLTRARAEFFELFAQHKPKVIE
jgi:hypothetical protein